MRPPWTRWRATHPQRVTRLPMSAVDRSPQEAVLVTHWSWVGEIGGLGVGLGMGVEVEVEAEAEAEAEEEKMEVGLGRGLGKDGLRKRKEWDRRGRCLGRRGRRGKVLRRRDMADGG